MQRLESHEGCHYPKKVGGRANGNVGTAAIKEKELDGEKKKKGGREGKRCQIASRSFSYKFQINFLNPNGFVFP